MISECNPDRITPPCDECVALVKIREAESGAPVSQGERLYLLGQAARKIHGGSAGRVLASRWEDVRAALAALDEVM